MHTNRPSRSDLYAASALVILMVLYLLLCAARWQGNP